MGIRKTENEEAEITAPQKMGIALEVMKSGKVLDVFQKGRGRVWYRVCKEENEKDEFKSFGLETGKMEVLSAEMEKASREEVEVPGAQFWTCYFAFIDIR